MHGENIDAFFSYEESRFKNTYLYRHMYIIKAEWDYLRGGRIIANWVREMIRQLGQISERHIL